MPADRDFARQSRYGQNMPHQYMICQLLIWIAVRRAAKLARLANRRSRWLLVERLSDVRCRTSRVIPHQQYCGVVLVLVSPTEFWRRYPCPRSGHYRRSAHLRSSGPVCCRLRSRLRGPPAAECWRCTPTRVIDSGRFHSKNLETDINRRADTEWPDHRFVRAAQRRSGTVWLCGARIHDLFE